MLSGAISGVISGVISGSFADFVDPLETRWIPVSLPCQSRRPRSVLLKVKFSRSCAAAKARDVVDGAREAGAVRFFIRNA